MSLVKQWLSYIVPNAWMFILPSHLGIITQTEPISARVSLICCSWCIRSTDPRNLLINLSLGCTDLKSTRWHIKSSNRAPPTSKYRCALSATIMEGNKNEILSTTIGLDGVHHSIHLFRVFHLARNKASVLFDHLRPKTIHSCKIDDKRAKKNPLLVRSFNQLSFSYSKGCFFSLSHL